MSGGGYGFNCAAGSCDETYHSGYCWDPTNNLPAEYTKCSTGDGGELDCDDTSDGIVDGGQTAETPVKSTTDDSSPGWDPDYKGVKRTHESDQNLPWKGKGDS